MDGGFVALLFGLVGVALIAAVPDGWLKAAGGILVAGTALFIILDVLRLLSR